MELDSVKLLNRFSESPTAETPEGYLQILEILPRISTNEALPCLLNHDLVVMAVLVHVQCTVLGRHATAPG